MIAVSILLRVFASMSLWGKQVVKNDRGEFSVEKNKKYNLNEAFRGVCFLRTRERKLTLNLVLVPESKGLYCAQRNT